MLDAKVDISRIKDSQTVVPPPAPEPKTYVNVVPMMDDSPHPKIDRKRRQDPQSTSAPQTSKISQGHSNSRSRSRQPLKKLAKTNAPAPDSAAGTAVTHTNQIIRDLLEKKGYQIIADHQVDRLADLDEETCSANVTAAEEDVAVDRKLPSDEDAMLYFANMISAFNKGSVSEMRTAIEHMLATNAVFRSHVICLPGSDNPNFTDKVIPGKQLLLTAFTSS
jgi:hypothetical protein